MKRGIFQRQSAPRIGNGNVLNVEGRHGKCRYPIGSTGSAMATIQHHLPKPLAIVSTVTSSSLRYVGTGPSDALKLST